MTADDVVDCIKVTLGQHVTLTWVEGFVYSPALDINIHVYLNHLRIELMNVDHPGIWISNLFDLQEWLIDNCGDSK